MLLGWPDETLRRTCTTPELGTALWGPPGWALVQELLTIVDQTTPLAGLVRFGTVQVVLDRVGTSAVVAMRYRAVELLGHPFRGDGPMALSAEDASMSRAGDADRLLVADVRCERRGPSRGESAA